MKTLLIAMVMLIPSIVSATLNVVTSTEDLAAIARDVGGEHIEVVPLARGYQDPHFVDAKPSYLLKLRKADMLIVVGLELEVGWLPPLITNARNPKILPDGSGFVDASKGCALLQIPTGPIDRSHGDIHPFGNPHYWLDPENGRIIARQIATRLSGLDPAHAADFKKGLETLENRLNTKLKEWPKLGGVKVVTYHNSLPYFAQRFGMQIVDHVEPNPGVPPSPAHLKRLHDKIRQEHVALILVDPYFDDRLPKKLARDTGAQMLTFETSVGAVPAIQTYVDLFDYNLKQITEALGLGGKK